MLMIDQSPAGHKSQLVTTEALSAPRSCAHRVGKGRTAQGPGGGQAAHKREESAVQEGVGGTTAVVSADVQGIPFTPRTFPQHPIPTKSCRNCGIFQPTVEYQRPNTPSGRSSVCNTCHRERKARNERDYYYRDLARARRKRQEAKAADPYKYRAQHAFGKAVQEGRVKKPDSCSICGSRERLDGHHDDYSRRYDVRWVCRPCHSKIHRGLVS